MLQTIGRMGSKESDQTSDSVLTRKPKDMVELCRSTAKSLVVPFHSLDKSRNLFLKFLSLQLDSLGDVGWSTMRDRSKIEWKERKEGEDDDGC